MAIFEVGKKYYDTSACDHNCIFVVEIVKRTAKTVTFRRNGQERRAKIHTDNNGEYIIPERYSMAPVFRASREYVEAPEEAEEAFQGQGYGVFKPAVGDAVVELLRPIREEAGRLMADKAYLEGIYKEGAERASHLAAKTLRKVYKKVGFLPR